MEREKLEKLRRKADKDKAEAAKRAAAAAKVKGEKVTPHAGDFNPPATSDFSVPNLPCGFWNPP
jgi:hypothetical protein